MENMSICTKLGMCTQNNNQTFHARFLSDEKCGYCTNKSIGKGNQSLKFPCMHLHYYTMCNKFLSMHALSNTKCDKTTCIWILDVSDQQIVMIGADIMQNQYTLSAVLVCI